MSTGLSVALHRRLSCVRAAALPRAVRLALAGACFGALAPLASAQSERTRNGDLIDEVLVTEQAQDGYRIEDSSLSQLTENLRDTPQSILALSSELVQDRGGTSLNDALRNVPGITLGAGEFSWQGNNPSIRGFSSRDDLYLDGLRDFGSYARDPFNLESVEVLLGPSSILFGRGSTGGAINQVTKRPRLTSATDVAVNVGSDNTVRATGDFSRPLAALGDAAAFRLNLLAHEGEVANRDGARSERYGIAPSVAFGIGTDTELTLAYVRQSADDRPDYGLPWHDGRPAAVARHNYYGFESDYLETDAEVLTAHVAHAVSDTLRIDSRVRYAGYERRNRITEPLLVPPPAPGRPLAEIDVHRYVFIGESEEEMLGAQATATLAAGRGAVRHTLVAGVEWSDESSSPMFAFGIGAPSTSLLAPNWREPFTAESTAPRIAADTEAHTAALFVLDTLKLGDAWAVTLGARWDRFSTAYTAERFPGPPTPFNAGTAAGVEHVDQTDRVASYRAAVVYKPAERMSVYLAGSTSFNPSAQSLSFLTTGRGLGTENNFLAPEENESFELGLKMDLNEERLALSAALFEITKDNARVADPANPGFNTLGGEQRIRGVALDVSGMLTKRLFWTSGYAYLDSQVVRGAPGAATGQPLVNAPEHSLSVWANYRVSDRFDAGLGYRYVAEQLAQNTGAGRRVPAYSLVDAMVRYRLRANLRLKLNLTNLGDELYFEQLHPWHVIPGPGRTATLAVNVEL